MVVNLTKSQKLLAAGRLDEAAAALPPSGPAINPRIEILRSRIAAQAEGPRAALAVLESASEAAGSANAPVEVFAGIAQWDLANFTGALQHFDAALIQQPKNDLAHSYRALCLLARGDASSAAAIWKSNGFSDNAMFRVRTAEYIESRWLQDRSFQGDSGAKAVSDSSESMAPDSTLATAAARPKLRRALSQFYRRNFNGVLKFISPPPTTNDLEAFLAATSLEMLRRYDHALAYVTPFLPQRSEWPDAFIALNARLRLRQGCIASAARDFASVIVMGPEDFGINYHMGIVCLAYEKPAEARQYFVRAFTTYMVDTREFQWWQLEQILLNPSEVLSPAAQHPALPAL